MSQFCVKKSKLQGEILVPGSKSHSLRAILFGALGEGTSVVQHPLQGSDTYAMIEACQLMGAKIQKQPNQLIIEGIGGKIFHLEDVIQAGNSGIVLRFCAAVGALASTPVVVTGDYSIRHQRPMRTLLDGLQQLGVKAASMRGDYFAPVILQGPLRPGKAVIQGEDSQPVSALLIASAFAEGPIDLEVKNPGEIPWVSLTLDWFDRLGIAYEQKDFKNYKLFGHSKYEGFTYKVPGDFSSAAFPIAAALVTDSEVVIKNLDMQDSQGDKELIDVLKKMGAKIIIDEQSRCLHIQKGSQLYGISVDINRFVDAITILTVVACFAEGETHIRNAAIAKQKECNRIQCIASELRKMGAHITETEDGLIIRKSSLTGAHVHSYHDHRMVMSLAVAGMGAKGETVIGPAECVTKTFPTFLHDFAKLGAQIKELP